MIYLYSTIIFIMLIVKSQVYFKHFLALNYRLLIMIV